VPLNEAETTLRLGPWEHVWLHKGIQMRPVAGTPMSEIWGVQGYLTPGDVRYLWNVAYSLPPAARYLEIGSWMGLSAILVANALLANLNFAARVLCVDTWEGSPEHQLAQAIQDGTLYDVYAANVRAARMEHFIEPLRGRSTDIAKTIPDRTLDAIFVDGDHSYEGCLADLEAWLPKLKPGGRFFGHDADGVGGVLQAVQDFTAGRSLPFRVLPPPLAYYIWEVDPSKLGV
jgi:predicted O-methyltransferase YrrM